MEDNSFGIIVVDQSHGNKFLLLEQKAGHWSFAKGHKEGNETDEEAALRELREESGIEYVVLAPLPPILEKYSYSQNGEIYHKTVKYFIGFVDSATVTVQEAEINSYKWLLYEEALSTLTFPEGKEVLRRVQESLNKYAHR